ncbi:MAG: hypothetical protein HYV26_21070 [Candidatus Hydrogenedentes bacterium]|nr:hypothetical protein [Candidatus Hydrogenedentota bacterium]
MTAKWNKTFARTLPEATCIDKDILDALHELLPKGKERRARVRLIGVCLNMLRYNQHQLALFGREHSEKWEHVLQRVDSVRQRLGFDAVHLGASLSTSPRNE